MSAQPSRSSLNREQGGIDLDFVQRVEKPRAVAEAAEAVTA